MEDAWAWIPPSSPHNADVTNTNQVHISPTGASWSRGVSQCTARQQHSRAAGSKRLPAMCYLEIKEVKAEPLPSSTAQWLLQRHFSLPRQQFESRQGLQLLIPLHICHSDIKGKNHKPRRQKSNSAGKGTLLRKLQGKFEIPQCYQCSTFWDSSSLGWAKKQSKQELNPQAQTARCEPLSKGTKDMLY